MRRRSRLSLVLLTCVAWCAIGAGAGNAQIFVECPALSLTGPLEDEILAPGGATCDISTDGWDVGLSGDVIGGGTQPNNQKVDYDGSGRVLGVFERTAVLLHFPPTEPLQRVSGSGFTTTFTYDAAHRLIGTRTESSLFPPIVESLVYDSAGRVSQVSSTFDETATFTYDGAGHLSAVTTPTRSVSFAYDGLGRIVSVSGDATNAPWAMTYDAAGNLLRVTIPRGEEDYTYDALGRISMRVDENGSAAYVYDASNRVIRVDVLAPSARTVTITYDAAGNILSTSDTSFGSATWTYDALERLLSFTDREGGVDHFSYDSIGNLSHVLGADGDSVDLIYDTGAPIVSVPGPITAEAHGASGAVVTYSATGSDSDGDAVAVACSQPSGSTFPIGVSTVSCTATDAHGNASAPSSFTVTVVDSPPTLAVPAAITVPATSPAGATVSYTATARDVDEGALTPSCSRASGSTFGPGTTTVSCTATDPDNSANRVSSSFTITVVGASDQLTNEIAFVAGLGPGASFVGQLRAAQADLAAGDVVGACAQLADYANHVRAQSGKSLSVADATRLLTDERAIAAAVGC